MYYKKKVENIKKQVKSVKEDLEYEKRCLFKLSDNYEVNLKKLGYVLNILDSMEFR